MATGGIFQLITNDGKQDRMLMASALLKRRLEDARERRRHEADPTPTLHDIESTHILFTNAHFKPFAAIGYEYNKVTATSGSSSLGSKITFSIPQFGDFFNDMVVHAVLSQPQLATQVNSLDVPASRQNLMRWCAYPGERLLKKVKFEVNGNPLDEYTSDAVNYHREFSVQPNKKLAWERCVGQEEDQVGHVDQPNWVNSGVAASDITYRTNVGGSDGLQTPTGQKTGSVELFIPLLFWCNKDPRLAVPSVAIPYGQRFITIELAGMNELAGEVARGFTPSLTSTAYSDANVAVGGAFEKNSMKLETIELYINNIFVNPEVHNIFIKRIGFTLIRVHRLQTHESAGGAGGSTESVLLQNLKWPIEALFVGMRVNDYQNNTTPSIVRANLDKWYTFSTVTDTNRVSQGWSSSKATVVEAANVAALLPSATSAIFTAAVLGDAPVLTVNVSATGIVGAGDILSFTSTLAGVSTGRVVGPLTVASVSADGLVITFVEDSSVVTNYDDVDTGGTLNLTLPATLATSLMLTRYATSPLAYTVKTCSPNLTNVTIKAHGIPIYNNFPTGFFNAYIPYNYGGGNIRAPSDCGALLVTFCLYPGTYQPSGHINISRAREFYIDYTTQNIDGNAGARGNLVIVASAINFLLISDGSAVLRYST
jgi:hypothetical protein